LVFNAKIKSPNVDRLNIAIPVHIRRLQSLDLLKEVKINSVMKPRMAASAIMNAKMIQEFGPISEGIMLN